MDFRILGPLEVVGAHGPVTLPRGQARALLALLVLRAGEVVPSSRLIDELWGEDPPPTAATALQGLVSTLRKRLEPARASGEEPAVIRTRAPGYLLAIGGEQVDATRFRRLVEQAAGAPAPHRVAMLREGLALWRGPVLADVADQPFAQPTIAALEELRLTALEERIAAELELGRHAELVPELEAVTAEHPTRERLLAHRMVALYRCGRLADALAVYTDARKRLVETLGIEPGPALRDLEQALLRQDPSLELASVALPGRTPTGVPATAASWLPQERRTVTVAFIQLATSAGTAEHPDPEVLQQVMRRCLDATTEIVTRHEGTVQGFIGGVVVAVFGIPTIHEDDALRAVRAAAELRTGLARLGEQFDLTHGIRVACRVGIDTGEVVLGDLAGGTTGHAATGAARLQQAAADGEVLLGEATRRLVADTVLVEAVGLDEGTPPAWRLVDAGIAPSVDPTGLVGRKTELRRLTTALQRAIRERRAVRVTVIGDAGIGKSRLALEFARMVEARVVTGRCPAYGEGLSFWPLREIVMEVTDGSGDLSGLLAGHGDGPAIVEQIAGVIGGATTGGSSTQPLPAVRRFFEALAARQPLVVVIIEDLHWAQPTFLDLLDYLTESLREPVLLLGLARPELLEQRRDWAANRDNRAAFALEPLSPEDSRQLLAVRLAAGLMGTETAGRIVDVAGGNPLFLEQFSAAVRDELSGALGDELPVPPSLRALLAARLERLGPAERDLLRTASVLGVDVPVDALTALIPEEARRFVDRHLRSLVDKELIRPSTGRVWGRNAVTFGHVLIQAAAYRSLTRQARSELHERVAAWLEDQAEPASPELDALVGYHLEQAHAQRRELHPLDGHTQQLAVRAGERLADAGLRAYGRFDAAATVNLLSRARALLPADHPRSWEIVQPLPEMYQVLGRHRDAARLLDEMVEMARAEEDPRRALRIRVERARIRLMTGHPDSSAATVLEETDRALQTFEELDDDAGIAQASFVAALARLRRGELHEMEESARRGLVHAQRARQPRDEVANRWFVAFPLVEGDLPVPDCIQHCEQLARVSDGGLHPGVLTELARLHAMRERFRRAGDLLAQARTLFLERMRGRRPSMFLEQRCAAVALLAGDHDAAEEQLRTALDHGLEMGEPDEVAQMAAVLSGILSLKGSRDEAARLASLSTRNAPPDSVAAQALSRTATARVLVERAPADADRLAREAIALVPPVMLNLRADLHVNLARILLTVGQHDAARTALDEAIDLYERKGNLAGAHRARRVGAAEGA